MINKWRSRITGYFIKLYQPCEETLPCPFVYILHHSNIKQTISGCLLLPLLSSVASRELTCTAFSHHRSWRSVVICRGQSHWQDGRGHSMCLEYEPSPRITSGRSSTDLSVPLKSHTLALGTKDVCALQSASILKWCSFGTDCVVSTHTVTLGWGLFFFLLFFVFLPALNITSLAPAAKLCHQRKEVKITSLILSLNTRLLCFSVRFSCVVALRKIIFCLCRCALQPREELDVKLVDSTVIRFRLVGELCQWRQPAVLLKLTGSWLNDTQKAVVSVSAAPRGAIIAQWLVKTREPQRQQWGRGGESEWWECPG